MGKKKIIPLYHSELIPYYLFLSPSQLQTFKKINSQGFSITLNNKKLNTQPNIVINLDEDQIKKLEKAKRKGVGARITFEPAYFSRLSVGKKGLEKFNEFLTFYNLSSKDYYEMIAKKRRSKKDINRQTIQQGLEFDL